MITLKTASYYASRKIKVLVLEIIENGRRREYSRIEVSGKVEARNIADATGFKPWNF